MVGHEQPKHEAENHDPQEQTFSDKISEDTVLRMSPVTRPSVLEDEIDKTVTMLYRIDLKHQTLCPHSLKYRLQVEHAVVGKTSCLGSLSYVNGWQASRDGRCSAQQQKGWAKGRQGQTAVRFDRV